MLSRLDWRGAVYLILIAVAAALVVVWWPQLTNVWREHLLTYVVITLLMALAIFVQAGNFLSFLRVSNRLGIAAAAHLWAVGALVNYLGPFQPGLAVRVAMLARLGIPVIESSIATLRQVFASLWLGLAIAAISLLWSDGVAMAIPGLLLIATFVSVLWLMPVLRNFATRVLSRSGRANLVPHVRTAISLPSLRAGLGILTQYAISTLVFWVGYDQFGVQITVAAALGLACAIYVSSMLPLLPANFGVLEALCTAFGKINGMSVEQSLALAFLYRGASITGALLLAAIPSAMQAEAK